MKLIPIVILFVSLLLVLSLLLKNESVLLRLIVMPSSFSLFSLTNFLRFATTLLG